MGAKAKLASALALRDGWLSLALPPIVTVEWLAEELRGSPEEYVLLDARSEPEYRAAHLPGARPMDLFELFVETTPAGLERLQAELVRRFGGAGLTGQEPIIVYESACGSLAPRVRWFLCYLGAREAAVLEGGAWAWRAAGHPLIRATPPPPEPAEFHMSRTPALLASVEALQDLDRSPRWTLLDVRTQEEFLGLERGACCPRSGRLPRAHWLEWYELLAGPRRFFSGPEAIAVLKARGIPTDRPLVTYCHRGARGAAASLVLERAGLREVRTFVGSWHEWAARSKLPVEIGPERSP